MSLWDILCRLINAVIQGLDGNSESVWVLDSYYDSTCETCLLRQVSLAVLVADSSWTDYCEQAKVSSCASVS
jgi:hypothetical protein